MGEDVHPFPKSERIIRAQAVRQRLSPQLVHGRQVLRVWNVQPIFLRIFELVSRTRNFLLIGFKQGNYITAFWEKIDAKWLPICETHL